MIKVDDIIDNKNNIGKSVYRGNFLPPPDSALFAHSYHITVVSSSSPSPLPSSSLSSSYSCRGFVCLLLLLLRFELALCKFVAGVWIFYSARLLFVVAIVVFVFLSAPVCVCAVRRGAHRRMSGDNKVR